MRTRTQTSSVFAWLGKFSASTDRACNCSTRPRRLPFPFGSGIALDGCGALVLGDGSHSHCPLPIWMNPGTLACAARQHWTGHMSGDPTDDLQRHGGLEVPAERVARADGGCPVVREEEREGLLRLPQPVGIHVFRTRVPTRAGYVATRNIRSLFCTSPFSVRIAGLGPGRLLLLS